MEIEAAMSLRLGCLANTSYSPQNQYKIMFQVSLSIYSAVEKRKKIFRPHTTLVIIPALSCSLEISKSGYIYFVNGVSLDKVYNTDR